MIPFWFRTITIAQGDVIAYAYCGPTQSTSFCKTHIVKTARTRHDIGFTKNRLKMGAIHKAQQNSVWLLQHLRAMLLKYFSSFFVFDQFKVQPKLTFCVYAKQKILEKVTIWVQCLQIKQHLIFKLVLCFNSLQFILSTGAVLSLIYMSENLYSLT